MYWSETQPLGILKPSLVGLGTSDLMTHIQTTVASPPCPTCVP